EPHQLLPWPWLETSAVDLLAGLDRHADLAAAFEGLNPHSGRLTGLGIGDRDVGDVNRGFATLDTAALILSGRLDVLGDHVDALDHDLVLVGQHSQDLAAGALVLAADDDDRDGVADLLHHSTSGARLTIRKTRYQRSSRATGPKMRVPMGLRSAPISTALLVSNRIRLPTWRRVPFLVRTIRSEERRVGTEWRTRRWQCSSKD